MAKHLTLTVLWLTGRYVAARVDNRDEPEWPPHPGRLFMALAATCFERGANEEEVAALRWLEELGAPEVHCSSAVPRSRVTAYVPTNDKLNVTTGALQSTPGISRTKQARSYPTMIPETDHTKFVWAIDADKSTPSHFAALQTLCGEVIRIGHSSSLVSVAADLQDSTMLKSSTTASGIHRWRPSDAISGISLRVATEGEFDRLQWDGMRERIKQFELIVTRAETGSAKEKKQAKADFLDAFGTKFGKNVRPPEPVPATIGTWASYSDQRLDARIENISQSVFDSGLVVLSLMDGPRLGLRDTLTVAARLRDAMMSFCGIQPAPEWVCGHDSDKRPTKETHLAIVPLAFAGAKYADGHLLGMGIAIPREMPSDRIRRCLGPVFYDGTKPRMIKLTLGQLGEWSLQLEQRATPPRMLQSRTWTRASRIWESVTPVVLDRFPKSDRRKEVSAWRDEVAQIIFRSCQFSGVPIPEAIDIDTSAFLPGVPRATRKLSFKRTMNSQHRLGDGFDSPPSGPGKPPRVQVHVRLRFATPVGGPILIGAGRFRGYGLLKPA